MFKPGPVLFIISVLVLSSTSGRTSISTNASGDAQIGNVLQVIDVTDFSIYYNVNTNQTIRKMMPRPWYRPGWPLRLPFYGGPCNCKGVQCLCCTGVRITRLNFTRELCTTLMYNISDSMIDMNVTVNGESIYRNSLSAANPPPFCIPLPVPYIPPGLMDMCMRLFDISIVDQHLHACMDIDTRIDMAPVLILHFDCMNMGFDGVSITKPGGAQSESSSSNTTLSTNSETTEVAQLDSDVYDAVTESDIMSTTTEYPFKNVAKYI